MCIRDRAGIAWADRQAAEQVLSNLLDNAIKYTEPGGRIEVAVDSRGDAVEARVADTGIGIPEEDLNRIFERFYRVDPGRSRDMGGTGLGLSIVKHLAEAQGGSVRVRHNEPRGTVFTIELQRSTGPMG